MTIQIDQSYLDDALELLKKRKDPPKGLVRRRPSSSHDFRRPVIQKGPATPAPAGSTGLSLRTLGPPETSSHAPLWALVTMGVGIAIIILSVAAFVVSKLDQPPPDTAQASPVKKDGPVKSTAAAPRTSDSKVKPAPKVAQAPPQPVTPASIPEVKPGQSGENKAGAASEGTGKKAPLVNAPDERSPIRVGQMAQPTDNNASNKVAPTDSVKPRSIPSPVSLPTPVVAPEPSKTPVTPPDPAKARAEVPAKTAVVAVAPVVPEPAASPVIPKVSPLPVPPTPPEPFTGGSVVGMLMATVVLPPPAPKPKPIATSTRKPVKKNTKKASVKKKRHATSTTPKKKRRRRKPRFNPF